jgi:S1-C subfamily serine protease
VSSERTETPTAKWDPLAGEWTEPLILRSGSDGRRPPRVPWLRAGVAGGIAGALIASLILVPLLRRHGTVVRSGSSTVIERHTGSSSSGVSGPVPVVDIAAAARPWVVNINVTKSGGFLGGLEGTGSGVILRSDGYILTSAHVVDGASSIEVTLASGEKLKARGVGVDDDTDVGVIKVDRTQLPGAVIGTAKNLRVGEIAIAIGSPLGLQQSVTEGIISALGRTFRRPDGGSPLVEMIQTDAAITHGNSGGALINGDGAVIGINTAIATSSGASEGIAFATPIDVAVAVAHELIASGRATHPWLGVTGGNITPETAKKFGVTEGARLVSVLAGSPAAKAGIRPDDVIVSFAGERIKSMDELIVAIRNHKVGDAVAVEVVRGGRHVVVRATLQEKPRTL